MPRNSFLFFGYFVFFCLFFSGAIVLQRGESRISISERPSEISESPSSEVLTEQEAFQIEKHSESSDQTFNSLRTPNYNSAPEKTFSFSIRTNLAVADTIRNHLTELLQSQKLNSKVIPLKVELVDDRSEPRGNTSEDRVSLIVTLPSESETVKVFGHELGHVVDLQYLRPGRFSGDPSDDFYAISWLDYKTKKKGLKLSDFVSGYAMTNKYEDFAESFAMYMFHNEIFESKARKNPLLKAKFDFFESEVFTDSEFSDTSFELRAPEPYFWDTTKIPIALNKYLYYLK